MAQNPIPSDWNGQDWQCYILDWPNSVQWSGLLRGLITLPTRGRFWDGSTGSILNAQAIGREIENRNPIMDCSEIVTALDAITAAINAIDVSQQQSLIVQQDISASATATASATAALQATMKQQSIAISNSYAWATAFAQSTASVKIINQVSLECRPLQPGVTEPPQPQEETETGITSTPQSSDADEICKRVFWLVYTVRTMFNHWFSTSIWVQSSILSFLGSLSVGLSVAALKGNPSQKAILVPAAALLQAAHFLTQLYYEDLVQVCISDLSEWINNDFECIIADVVTGLTNEDSTLEIQAVIMGRYLSYSGETFKGKFVNFLPLLFNLGSLAAMYYVTSVWSGLPDIPAEFGGTAICTVCGE